MIAYSKFSTKLIFLFFLLLCFIACFCVLLYGNRLSDCMGEKEDIQELLNFLLEYSTSLMGVGVQTARVVHNTTRIAKAFGFSLDMTIFQKSIIMTIVDDDDPLHPKTSVDKIKPLALNFELISTLSALSWYIYDNRPTLDEVWVKFRTIMAKPRMSRWWVLFLVSCANASFCRLFGGDGIAMAVVFLATLVGFLIRQEMMNRHMNHLFIFVVSAFVASMVGGIVVINHWGNTPEIALASSVLYLIPGVPLINSVIDFMDGHVLAGFSRLINACLLIICIAIGLSITLLILGVNSL